MALTPLRVATQVRGKKRDLAIACQVSRPAVSRWIKTGYVSRRHAIPAARYLGLQVGQLVAPGR